MVSKYAVALVVVGGAIWVVSAVIYGVLLWSCFPSCSSLCWPLRVLEQLGIRPKPCATWLGQTSTLTSTSQPLGSSQSPSLTLVSQTECEPDSSGYARTGWFQETPPGKRCERGRHVRRLVPSSWFPRIAPIVGVYDLSCEYQPIDKHIVKDSIL